MTPAAPLDQLSGSLLTQAAHVSVLLHTQSKDLMPSGVQRRYYREKPSWRFAK